jgi:hypothetical protein
MVAIGVMSLGGYFLISLLKNSVSMQKGVTSVDNARSLNMDIVKLLVNPQACLNTFGGATGGGP